MLLFWSHSPAEAKEPIILGSQPLATNTISMTEWGKVNPNQGVVLCNQNDPEGEMKLFDLAADHRNESIGKVKGCIPMTILKVPERGDIVARYDGLNTDYAKKAYKINRSLVTGAYAHIPTSQLIPGTDYTLCRVKRHGNNGLSEAQKDAVFGNRECVVGTYLGFTHTTLRNPTAWTIGNTHFDLVSFNDVYVAPK